jgi:catechol 2,3-dioxygenase-like lactoylglutathione lyase family enzyme
MTDRAIAVLPSSDFERSWAFYRYFGFTLVARDEAWLHLRKGSVELDFTLTERTAGDRGLVGDRLCLVRVADVAAWHAVFAGTRMRWKALGVPSLTAISSAAWGVPAFCITDRDGNLIWVVQDA